jgi:la-related protein 1
MSTPTKTGKMTIASPKQEPIGSPLQSPKGVQSTMFNTPPIRRALSFHDDEPLYAHFDAQSTPTPAPSTTTTTAGTTNNPSPWTKSGQVSNMPPAMNIGDDELSPTQIPQPFSSYFGFPSVIQENGSSAIPPPAPKENKQNARSNSLFSDSPPFLKRPQSVSFAPAPTQEALQNNYQQQSFPISQSYPRQQYGMNHVQQQHQYPSSYPMYAPNYQSYTEQYNPWFETATNQTAYQQGQNKPPHLVPMQQQQQQQYNQQQQPFSPTRNVPFKSPKSKSYPSSPNRSPNHAQAKRGHNPRVYGGANYQNGFVPHAQQQQQQQAPQHHHVAPVANPAQQPQQQAGSFEPATEGNRCRGMYKEFAKDVKEMEKSGYKPTRDYVTKNIHTVPFSVHWRVYMDLADLAKRENMISEARKWFKKVNDLQPSASQGWLEHAKLEEECGRLEHCEKLLLLGLDHCPQNESLLVKAIKHFEQVQNVGQARGLLARLRNMSLEKSWKIMLEGALLESRMGNVETARRVFKYLMQHVSRHGPIYYEAYRLEEKCEEWEKALEIVERGLEANPRYGPLWFAAFHLYEKRAYLNSNPSEPVNLDSVRECLDRAVQNISKELIWKVHFEQAQIEERARNIDLSRRSYCRSVVASMSNLRWKVWLAGSRTELNQNNIATARTLLNRALEEVPVKTRAVVLIECARLEEYTNDLKKARQFLKRAQREAKHEWKVFLESILLEMRAGEHERAIEEAKKALKIHRGTGRLWAVLIQLKGCLEGPDAQLKVFREALDEVPKSGEVWCEGARIRLNPLTSKFNLEKARKYLDFAIKFTPQYGDSFIEYLRLELLTRGPYDDSTHYNGEEIRPFDNAHYDIEQLCVNADPNYGPLWFHCKENVLDSTRQVLRRAKKLLMAELLEYGDLYQQAIMSGNSTVSNSSTVVVNNTTYSCRDFITGLHELNMTYSNASVNDMALKKKYIYGSEICV